MKNRKITKQFIVFFTFILSLISHSQTINLETSFGTNGIKSISVDGEVDRLEILDFESNNFLVYSKIYFSTSNNENLVFKVNTDGTFENSFGTNGKLVLPNYKSQFKIFKQGNDKFIVAFGNVLPFGTINNERAILRYNSNGTLDNTFGSNGEIRINYVNNSSNEVMTNILILDDNSILFSDVEKFIKFTENGILDNNYGVNGVVNVDNLGDNMMKSQEGNVLFYNTLNIEKRNFDGNLINSFGLNGIYSFPTQNYYQCKSNNNKLSFIEDKDLPVKFYDLNSNGTLNTNFNSTGYVDLTDDNNTLEYCYDFIFSNDILYFVGNTKENNPFIFCYNSVGNLMQLNNSNSYKELQISDGTYTSVMIKNNVLYAAGDFIDKTNNIRNLTIGKYNFSTLSVLENAKQSNVYFQNPIQNELIISSENEINLVEIYTLDSRKIETSYSNLVNTSNLNKGVYLIKIKFMDGKVVTKKIVKK